MKTKIIRSSFLVLFAIVATITGNTPAVFADHAEAHVSIPAGSSVPGCEETNECWIPAEVTVDVGGEVTWSNGDTAAHTVTSGTAAEGPDGNFDSSLFMAGETFSATFDTAGEFPYFCMVHPWMTGVVIVQEAGAEEEPAGEVVIDIESEPVGTGEIMTIEVEFEDMAGNYYEHVNYNIKATQNGQVVLDDQGVHDHDGQMSHTTMPLPATASGDNPVDVEVEFLGFGIDPPFTGPIGEVGTTQVIPEFGTIAMMVLGVAIISIIAVTVRSKVIPRL